MVEGNLVVDTSSARVVEGKMAVCTPREQSDFMKFRIFIKSEAMDLRIWRFL